MLASKQDSRRDPCTKNTFHPLFSQPVQEGFLGRPRMCSQGESLDYSWETFRVSNLKGVPIMTLVSLTDCCHLLAVDPKTLRRWMSLFQLEALPHPNDARIKCVTSDMIQQLALTHHRTLPDRPGIHRVQAISVPATPAVAGDPVLADVPTGFPVLVGSLLKQLSSLQAHVAMLQHQLTFLTDQLQKEQEWRTSQVSMGEGKYQEPPKEKSLESPKEKSLERSKEKSQGSPREKSLESPKEKSLESSQEKESTRAKAAPPLVDRRKRPCVLPLVEYGTQGKYVVISPEQGLLDFEPDSPEWFAWLSTLTAFRFVGPHGHLTAHRQKCRPSWSWRATRSIRYRTHSLHLVSTESLTLAVLEQAAASLQSLLD